jgi:DNA-binding response OmpR family regulator
VPKNPFRKSETAKISSVFLIDDDAAVVQFIVKILEDQGYVVHTASNGVKALTLLDEVPLPDVFVVDFTLPEMNGQQFIENARVRFGRVALPPVLLLTAAKEGEATANLLQVEDYLPKPFNSEQLLEHIKVLISSRAIGSAAGA